jgi:hypothetical protein
MSAVLERTKLLPVEVIETGMGIIFPIGAGPGVGVGPIGVGVGGFALGAGPLLAEACMAFAARIIKTRAKTRNVRKTFFVCIEIPLSFNMGG